MRVDAPTISSMFAVLRNAVVGGGAPQVIRFFTVTDVAICDIDFDDIEEESTALGNFYFRDPNDSKVIRGVVTADGVAHHFEIYDSTATNVIMSGDVSLLNSGGDITFNSLDWKQNEVAIISSLRIYFPTE